MKTKSTTITFGTSANYFKTSVSLSFKGDSDEDFEQARQKVRKMYFKALAMELDLYKKFTKMDMKEIKNFLKKEIENE